MEIAEIKDLMAQFDSSSLREFAYTSAGESLQFSKNERQPVPAEQPAQPAVLAESPVAVAPAVVPEENEQPKMAEGELVESPLVGVAYLAPGPDKPAFVAVGDTVKKGQTLLIVEAMKVMNEIPAPHDGVITEVLVDNQEVVEFGQGLVRIK